MPSIGDEIKQHKAQLKDFLVRKYIDQSLLLGFINVLQSKYQAWILSDLSGYYNEIELQHTNGNIDFNTIKFFETIWQDFHYPIIKFFQFHHTNLYNHTLLDFENHQKSNSGNFKVKPVEMRKMNDNFVKFIKQVSSFYHTLLKYFSTHYKNQLLPNELLTHFNYEVPNNAIDTKNPNLQANIVFLIHRCLLSLGDLSRHSTFIELTYVKPCISNREFFKYRSFSSNERSTFMKPFYDRSLTYYKFCILLLPALNEPYNHIGMIHNIIDEKYEACYWFLRSQFTRIPNYGLGLSNFNAVIKKNWFLTNLVDIKLEESDTKKKSKDSLSKEEQLNYVLVCLIGFYYYPETYRRGPNIVKNLKYTNIENDFFKDLFKNSDLITENLKDDVNLYVKQLVFLFCILKLLEQRKATSDIFRKFEKFVFRYIGKFFEFSTAHKGSQIEEQNILICLRLILNWLKENKNYFKSFNSSEYIIDKFVKLLNSLIDKVEDPKKIKTLNDILKSNSRPIRYYYFREDVYFRDFSLIKFQFKDFKDDHLFNSNNINLLLGDFLDYYKNPNLDETSLSSEELELRDIVLNFHHSKDYSELLISENIRRLKAVVLLGKKCLEGKDLGVSYNFDLNKFELKNKYLEIHHNKIHNIEFNLKEENSKRDEKTIKRKPNKNVSKKEKKSDEPIEIKIHSQIEPEVESEVIRETTDIKEQKQVPDTLEEIESYILHHTTKLQDEMMKDISQETPDHPEEISKELGKNTGLNEIQSFIKHHSDNLQKSIKDKQKESTPVSENLSTTASSNNSAIISDKNMMPINSNPQNFKNVNNIWNNQSLKQSFPNPISSPSPQLYQNPNPPPQYQTVYTQHQTYPYPPPAASVSQYHQVALPSAHNANRFINSTPSVMSSVNANMGSYGVATFQTAPQYPPNSAPIMGQSQSSSFHYPPYTTMNSAQVPIPHSAPHMVQYNQNTYNPNVSNNKFNHYHHHS